MALWQCDACGKQNHESFAKCQSCGAPHNAETRRTPTVSGGAVTVDPLGTRTPVDRAAALDGAAAWVTGLSILGAIGFGLAAILAMQEPDTWVGTGWIPGDTQVTTGGIVLTLAAIGTLVCGWWLAAMARGMSALIRLLDREQKEPSGG